MAHKKIPLNSIQTLTFYADTLTQARRTSPIPQLKCRGPACSLFEPDVVQCRNMGGSGSEIEWKCEADLPASIRMGRVEVSCEGWSSPDDPNILKGSCGLEYNLIRSGRGHLDDSGFGSMFGSKSNGSFDLLGLLFWIVFIGVGLWIAFGFISSLLGVRPNLRNPNWREPRSWFTGSGGGGGGGGGGGPGFGGGAPPPPPYSKYDSPQSQHPAAGAQQPRFGFWSGLGAGAIGTQLLFGGGGNLRNRNQGPYGGYDRDDVWGGPRGFGAGGGMRRPARNNDLGEGPSNLGQIRSSTGFGGTRNR